MKAEKQFVSIEITCKRSKNSDPITQDTVEKCIKIAMKAHEGQRDRDGNAVILHPLLVGSMGKTDAEKCVGFLHDVVEDTSFTFDDLRGEGIPEEIIEALQLCTHREGQDYYDYVQRIIDSGNLTAINVKLNDLHHNIARGKAFGYPDLISKHERALKMIEDNLNQLKPSVLQSFISRCQWTFAKTMPWAPHEYIVRDKCPLTDEEFVYFIKMQRKYGKEERWGKHILPYLYIDDYKYWTMGDPIEDTTIINRAKAE